MNRDDDEALRRQLRDALQRCPADGLQPLQARVQQQWQRQHTGALRPGPLAVLLLGWRRRPAMASAGVLVLGIALVLAMHAWNRPDAGTEELKQLDVLSLMSLGEL